MIGNGHQQRPGRTWKVGALARAIGLTVKTLHHYDEIGLLQPSARLAGGHRLYDADDVARLYRIIRLCPLGFPLSQVADVLAEPEWQLAPAIERHLSLYVQSAAFRRYAAETRRNCVTDIALLLTFLWAGASFGRKRRSVTWRITSTGGGSRRGTRPGSGFEVGPGAGGVHQLVRLGGQEQAHDGEPGGDETGPPAESSPFPGREPARPRD